MNDHKTSPVAIKVAEIDNEIIPVIKWLNSFRWVYTRWCCQGDSDPKGNNFDNKYSYVIFYLDSTPEDLRDICQALDNFATIHVEYYKWTAGIRYKIVFNSYSAMKRFIESINNKQVSIDR